MSLPSDPGPEGNPELLASLREEIRARGPITFARFMERCLYDPQHGYYTRGGARLGRGGDFVTARDAGTAFGECLARQLGELDSVLGHPERFRVVELGAGRGLLARDVRGALAATDPGLAARLHYVLVDRSPGMRETARDNVPGVEIAADPAAGAGPGCALAVELFDALPVNRVRRRRDELRELLVDLDAAGGLVEREAPPGDELRRWVERYRLAPHDGDEAEIALGAHAALERMTGAITRGFLLIVDYGHSAAELADRRHRRGTLLAYHRHQAHERYLERVGEQDLTAHVNFSALTDRARELGLVPLGRTTQDRFLIANGIVGAFDPGDDADYRDPAGVRRRLRAMQLIHPLGMGRRFHVLAFAKDVHPRPTLRGLADPFA